jgi:hypothetical protein
MFNPLQATKAVNEFFWLTPFISSHQQLEYGFAERYKIIVHNYFSLQDRSRSMAC